MSTAGRSPPASVDDPTFFIRCWEPAHPEADHTDPEVWDEANPSLGAFLHVEDLAAEVASTDENGVPAVHAGAVDVDAFGGLRIGRLGRGSC